MYQVQLSPVENQKRQGESGRVELVPYGGKGLNVRRKAQVLQFASKLSLSDLEGLALSGGGGRTVSLPYTNQSRFFLSYFGAVPSIRFEIRFVTAHAINTNKKTEMVNYKCIFGMSGSMY